MKNLVMFLVGLIIGFLIGEYFAIETMTPNINEDFVNFVVDTRLKASMRAIAKKNPNMPLGYPLIFY